MSTPVVKLTGDPAMEALASARGPLKIYVLWNSGDLNPASARYFSDPGKARQYAESRAIRPYAVNATCRWRLVQEMQPHDWTADLTGDPEALWVVLADGCWTDPEWFLAQVIVDDPELEPAHERHGLAGRPGLAEAG